MRRHDDKPITADAFRELIDAIDEASTYYERDHRRRRLSSACAANRDRIALALEMYEAKANGGSVVTQQSGDFMTDERIAALRRLSNSVFAPQQQPTFDRQVSLEELGYAVPDLLGEIERLRETIARVEAERDAWANQATFNEEKRWRLEQRIKRGNGYIYARINDLGEALRSGVQGRHQAEIYEEIIDALNAALDALSEKPETRVS